jgi:hypothetical protein
MTADELHREKVSPVDFCNIVDAADIRVRQLACYPHLGKEALPAYGIIGVSFIMLRSRFQIHFAHQGLIARVGAQGIKRGISNGRRH